MSNDPIFPHGEGNSDFGQTQERESQFKRPEFILIDDRDGKNKYTHFHPTSAGTFQETFTEREEKQAVKGPLSLRFICLLGFIFCLIFGLGMFLWSTVMTLGAILTLFQNPQLNQNMRSFWKIFANAAIAGFGFTLGMISPTLGLGLLALYFSLASHLVKEDLLRRVIRSSFNHL